MWEMFEGASVFNQPLALDTSDVQDFNMFFSSCTEFNSPIAFDVSSATRLTATFQLTAYNQPLQFDTAHVLSFQSMPPARFELAIS